jgi:outer membrane protein insertion porin family
MRRSLLLAAALSALLIPRVLPAQSFTPSTIEFTGAPDLPTADLLAASQLQPGRPITMDQLRAHVQLLIDSGLFDDLHYNINGPALVIALTPSTQVFPARFVNLPIPTGPELEAKLHAQFPLYHGRVPADGSLVTGVRTALEQILSAHGLQATIRALPFTDPKAQAITEIDFSVYIPDVLIGPIHIDAPATTPAASLNELAATVQAIAAKIQGQPYDRLGSPDLIRTSLLVSYRDRGFLDCTVQPTPQPAVEVAIDQVAHAIRVPFAVSVEPGPLYHVASIQLAPGLAVTPADFDAASTLHPGDPADLTRLRPALDFITRQYRDTGHVRAQLALTPAIDRAHATVAYTIAVDPGPVYTMGRLAIENVSGTLRGEMLAAWKMPQGAVFNESAIMAFFSDRKLSTDRKLNDDLQRTFATINPHYILHIDDTTKSVAVDLILTAKPQ